MNEQHGKHLDRRIRQALDSLPDDVPAPGTAFDASKLWEQLRPELVATPVMVPKRTNQVQPAPIRRGWLVAASLVGVGLFLTWMRFVQPPTKDQSATENGTRYVARSLPVTPQVRITSTKKPVILKKQIVDHQYVSRKKYSVKNLPSAENTLDNQPALVANVPEKTPVDAAPAEFEPVTSTLVVVVRKAAPTYPKRRFEVVHVNELVVQDEALSNQFLGRSTTERFVRVGVGAHVSVGPDESAPSILVPLTRKSPQY